jgi:hypothetical protein
VTEGRGVAEGSDAEAMIEASTVDSRVEVVTAGAICMEVAGTRTVRIVG